MLKCATPGATTDPADTEVSELDMDIIVNEKQEKKEHVDLVVYLN